MAKLESWQVKEKPVRRVLLHDSFGRICESAELYGRKSKRTRPESPFKRYKNRLVSKRAARRVSHKLRYCGMNPSGQPIWK